MSYSRTKQKLAVQIITKENNTHRKIEVTFQPENRNVTVSHGKTVLYAAHQSGIQIASLCNGQGTCGKCKITVEDQHSINILTASEKVHLSCEEQKKGTRLACQVTPQLDVTIFNNMQNHQNSGPKLQVEGRRVKLKLDPSVRKYFVRLPKPSLKDQRSDEERLTEALESQYGLGNLTIENEAMGSLPVLLRRSEWSLTAVVWRAKTIVAIQHGNTVDHCYGYAVDVGTTKLAGYLVDLTTGKVLDTQSTINPQVDHGLDLMSRIAFVGEEPKRLHLVQEEVVRATNKLIAQSCHRSGINQQDIYEIVAVGNTCMETLFLGFTPKYLGISPYLPVTRRGVDAKASSLGVAASENARLYFGPVIGGFVGADNIAALLTSNLLESEKVTLLMDIGTNTEIDLGNKTKALCCSCPSGPAFEGHHIKDGMQASSGAIEKISIIPESFEVRYTTIGSLPPRGVCGSGLIDAVAELLKSGIIDNRGTFRRDLVTPRLNWGENGGEFTIVFPEESTNQRRISITQRDIRELQKAKAAIFGGITLLLRQLNYTSDAIDRLVIAGAFGNYVNPQNATIVGMYPEVASQKILLVGNAAGTGARMMLTSRLARIKAEKINRRVKHYELSVDPDFPREYAKAMYLPNQNLSKFPNTQKLLEDLGAS